jgi:arthrofactin-type cyclic lipopeptide synthetase C
LVGGTRNIRRESLGLPVPFEPPEGDLETAIAEIFANVFGIDQVGANDEFFDLGGDSLLAEVLRMRLAEHTSHEIPLSSFLENDSPRRIAAFLTAAGRMRPTFGVRPSFSSR